MKHGIPPRHSSGSPDRMAALGRVVMYWAGILLGVYILLELTFPYYANRIFPYAALEHVRPEATVLIQHSKEGLVPREYIAIVGDSYAYGQGDWLYAVQHDIRPVYSAAQLLHKKTGRDVVSFGYPASDNIRAYNILPEILLSAARQLTVRDIKDPAQIIVYFYEGNDINDNVEVMDVKQLPSRSGDYQRDILPKLVADDPMVNEVKHISFWRKLLFANFVKNLAVDFYARTFVNDAPTPREPIAEGETTSIQMAGQVVHMPDRLQTPALTLSRAQIDDGVFIFGESLRYLKERFPESRIGVVYVPAVITPYHVISPSVNDYYKAIDGTHLVNSQAIESNSNYICHQVRNHAVATGVAFVDTRSVMRKAATNQWIHGPFDWNHFNRQGYEILTEALVGLLEQMNADTVSSPPDCQWQ